jgi:hypothetical protein
MEKWEYRVEISTSSDEKLLNDLGKKGWELVSVAVAPETLIRTFTFKRGVESEKPYIGPG